MQLQQCPPPEIDRVRLGFGRAPAPGTGIALPWQEGVCQSQDACCNPRLQQLFWFPHPEVRPSAPKAEHNGHAWRLAHLTSHNARNRQAPDTKLLCHDCWWQQGLGRILRAHPELLSDDTLTPPPALHARWEARQREHQQQLQQQQQRSPPQPRLPPPLGNKEVWVNVNGAGRVRLRGRILQVRVFFVCGGVCARVYPADGSLSLSLLFTCATSTTTLTTSTFQTPKPPPPPPPPPRLTTPTPQNHQKSAARSSPSKWTRRIWATRGWRCRCWWGRTAWATC